MGKKKDKASKSKKKSKTEFMVEAVAENETESEPNNIQYAEQVTAEDVMELINTLSKDLDQVDQSNQSLQQQIAQNQKTLQRQHTVTRIISIILLIGIVTIGYSTARISANKTENVDVDLVSTSMSKMREQIISMNASTASVSRDLKKFNTSLNTLAANVTKIGQSVSKVATDVSKINTSTASTTQPNTRYMGRPMDPWPRW